VRFDPVDADVQHQLDRRGPRVEVQEICCSEDVVLSCAEIVGRLEVLAGAAEIRRSLPRQPIGLVVLQPVAQLRPEPGETGGVRSAQPLPARAHQGIHGQRSHVERPRANTLGGVYEEEDVALPAERADGFDVGCVPRERVDPAHAQHARRRLERRRNLVRSRKEASGPQQRHIDVAAAVVEPGQDVGWEVALHEQHLISRAEGYAVGEQVQAVGCAVGQNDVLRGCTDEPAQGPLEARGHLVEAILGEQVGGRLPRHRLRGRVGRAARQRPLVGAVEPHASAEVAEVAAQVLVHGGENTAAVLPATGVGSDGTAILGRDGVGGHPEGGVNFLQQLAPLRCRSEGLLDRRPPVDDEGGEAERAQLAKRVGVG